MSNINRIAPVKDSISERAQVIAACYMVFKQTVRIWVQAYCSHLQNEPAAQTERYRKEAEMCLREDFKTRGITPNRQVIESLKKECWQLAKHTAALSEQAGVKAWELIFWSNK